MVMKLFVMAKGLPGCGKSTWAENAVIAQAPGYAVRVNMDLIRTMLHVDRFGGRKTENLTQAARDLLIENHMMTGVPVIISDDTNLNPKCEEAFRRLCEKHSYGFQVMDFTSVPVDLCIERDLKRSRSVGEKVIRKMWRKYLESPHNRVPAPAYVEGAPSAVIVDIDGTVALMQNRSPYDPSLYHTDAPNLDVVHLVQDLRAAGEAIVFCSGRDDTYRAATTQWIKQHLGFEPEELHMRPGGDTRKDSIVKRELYEAHIAGRYNVRFVLDDRNQVVDMWRGLGLTCLQVAAGDF